MNTWKITTSILIAAMILGGCDLKRRSDSGQGSGSDSGNGSNANFIVDDSGTTRLNAPSEIQQVKGREVTVLEHSTVGANSILPGKNWIYTTKPKNAGSFLVAATSEAGTPGGDMIRRIDLGSSIKEFDYDDETKGTQGAFIYVPDEIKSVVPSRLIDSDGFYTGAICALVPGPNKTVIALSGTTDGGVGFVINPYEEASAFTPLQAIRMPYAANPCRAVYSEANKKLYVVDMTRTESQSGQTGIFVADIYNDNRGVTASYYAFNMGNRINSHSIPNFMGVEIYRDVLYLLSGNGRFDNEWDSVVYSVPLNTAGEPIFDEYKYTRMNNPIMRSDGCNMSTYNVGAISIVEQGGKGVVLVSGTGQTGAWEINDDTTLKKIDTNSKKPGVQGYNLGDNGQGGPKFAYSPDGSKLYQLPHCRSNSNKVKIPGGSDVFMFNISAFNTSDLKLSDPIDIGYRDLLASLKNASYRPQFTGTMRDFAVGSKHIGIIGASASNLSGLGAGGDVNIIDIGKKTSISFSKPTDMRTAHEVNYGFKLAAGDPKFAHAEQNSHAIIWIP